MASQSMIRISKEIGDLQRNEDLSLAVACNDADVRFVRSMIIGPPDTPYEFGFFEFSMKFDQDYPRKPPVVTSLTTNAGRTRFNPNIYSSGKVCLSILGTWRGESGEQWSAAQGMESILLSIQSLMSSNPYENEPGFEKAHLQDDLRRMPLYAEKVLQPTLYLTLFSTAANEKQIRHETLRLTVIQRLEDYLNILPDGQAKEKPSKLDYNLDKVLWSSMPFKSLCKNRLLWYYSSYLNTVELGTRNTKPDQAFEDMPFESPDNRMSGNFNYPELGRRLTQIKNAIDSETLSWAKEGSFAVQNEHSIAANLANKYIQIVNALKPVAFPHELSLQDGNPFVWILTYFGKPMGDLDGGFFRIKIHFSPRFPEELPRVRMDPPIFHHRVAVDGTLCYFPNPRKLEDVMSHIHGIVDVLEEENPIYDPRARVNPKAFQMFWGSPQDRKMYKRYLRRSVEQMME
ncbi:hypothetical protein Cpir12675_002087 [Ceratocystis pirilliformis]|uniref:UBC core domain-containing protein n=1 Tax=Ceratocystis pirilliformis TaxID=259994 RepID=A0ABR3ZBR3_9PEZI